MMPVPCARPLAGPQPGPQPGPQRGAALVVALILVLVSAMLGLSVMQSGSVETQLANNEQFRESVFRTAEAASDKALADLDLNELESNNGTATPVITPVDSRVTVTAVQRIDGISHVPGTSIGRFRRHLVSASGTARITDLGAQRSVTQGASIRTLASGPR